MRTIGCVGAVVDSIVNPFDGSRITRGLMLLGAGIGVPSIAVAASTSS